MTQTLYWLVAGKILPFFYGAAAPPRKACCSKQGGISSVLSLGDGDRALGVALAPPQSERAGEAGCASAAAEDMRCHSWSRANRHTSVGPRGTGVARLPCNTVHMYLVTA